MLLVLLLFFILLFLRRRFCSWWWNWCRCWRFFRALGYCWGCLLSWFCCCWGWFCCCPRWVCVFFLNRGFLIDRWSGSRCFWGIPFFSFFLCPFGPTFIDFRLVWTRVLFLYLFGGSCFFSGSSWSGCGSSWLVFLRAEFGYMTVLLAAPVAWSSALHYYHHLSAPVNNSVRDGLKALPL